MFPPSVFSILANLKYFIIIFSFSFSLFLLQIQYIYKLKKKKKVKPNPTNLPNVSIYQNREPNSESSFFLAKVARDKRIKSLLEMFKPSIYKPVWYILY